MKFSERYGYTKPRDIFQLEEMDDALRTDLWNLFYKWYYNWNRRGAGGEYIWREFFREPIDMLPHINLLGNIKDTVMNGVWYGVYDFFEFYLEKDFYSAIYHPDMPTLDRTINNFNIIMERNNSAYRWVSGVVTRITDETEINTIDVAIQQNQYSGVRKHLQTALELLSNKTSPDYRNSAKESISAVESLCVQLCGEDAKTLGAALKELKKKHGLHPALEGVFSQLYGYTSDAKSGIRHGLTESISSIDYAEAYYMLVSCSAFINYLIQKIGE